MKRLFRYGIRGLQKLFYPIESMLDHEYLARDVPLAREACHSNWLDYLVRHGNKNGLSILEVGSREVTGKSVARERFSLAEYTGLDYYAGANVDVVGDAHALSEYFPEKKFDVIFSSACFEHFAMPWLVSTEMQKVLKVGGYLFVETHFSWSSHERPWHFFQFSDLGLRVLFPEVFGMKCVDAGVSNPMIGRYSKLADPDLRGRPISRLYCHSSFLGQKAFEPEHYDWRRVTLESVVSGSQYPPGVNALIR
jgi:SAM-dependent methyltransferase